MSRLKFGDTASIDSVGAAAKGSPVDRMRVCFGTVSGSKCGDCSHYHVAGVPGTSNRSQTCDIFQRTGKCTTWAADAQACGKFEAR